MLESFSLNKVSGLELPVTSATFLRTPFLKNTSGRLLLNNDTISIIINGWLHLISHSFYLGSWKGRGLNLLYKLPSELFPPTFFWQCSILMLKLFFVSYSVVMLVFSIKGTPEPKTMLSSNWYFLVSSNHVTYLQ